MKKIILLSLMVSSVVFATDNLVTIIENNSLGKIGKNTIYASANSSDKITINDAYKAKTFKNYSPYWYDMYEETYDTSPSVITMVGEKSIQYGSIYSKGFGKKFNINTLGVLISREEFSTSLKVLDTFNKDDLIYARTRLNVYTKDDFTTLETYINENLDEDNKTRYLNRLEYIYDILNLTNTLYEKEISEVNIGVIRPSLFNYQEYLNRSKLLEATSGVKKIWNNRNSGSTETKQEYILSGNTITRYCAEPYQVRSEDDSNSDSYNYNNIVDYRIKAVSSIDISKPIPLNSMYMFKYAGCAKISGNNWYPKIENPKIPSSTNQKIKILSEMKILRNGGSYLSKMKSFYSSMNNDINIRKNLKSLSDRGLSNGKIIHINYGLGESINNGKLIAGLVKNVSLGILFNSKINFLMNEGFVFDIDNPPSSFLDKTNSISELSKEDVDGNSFSTLYYIVNQKLQSNVPEKDNFHMYSNIIPSASKISPMNEYFGGEMLWLADKEGKFIPNFSYNNKNEILIDEADDFGVNDLISGMKSYSRSQIDTSETPEIHYPLNLKGITFKYIPKNTKNNALKYFGPRFDGIVYLDSFKEKIITTVPLNCTVDECTDSQKSMTTPTKEEISYETKKYCGIEFNNPDTTTYEYFVFENIYNRIIEEPFGDVQYHANKADESENNEIFISNQKVPKIFKYIGEVQDSNECIGKINIALESSLETSLINNDVLGFDFQEDVDSLDTMAGTIFGERSEKITILIDEFLMNKDIYTKSLELKTETTLEDDVSYEESNKDTLFNYYKYLSNLNPSTTGVVNDVNTVIIFKETPTTTE